MNDEAAFLRLVNAVVPDSGTGDPSGLEDPMMITMIDAKHLSEPDCMLPDVTKKR